MQDTHHPASNISSNQVLDNTLTIVIGSRMLKPVVLLAIVLLLEQMMKGNVQAAY